MAILTALTLGLINLKKPSIEERIEPEIRLSEVSVDTQSMVNGQMVCIRLEPLSRVWGDHDRRNRDQVSSYSECQELKKNVLRLKWRTTLHHFNVHLEIKQKAIKANLSRLVVSLMTRLNYNRVRKELLRHPCVMKEKEPRTATGRQLYLKRRWRNVYFRNSWTTERSRVNVQHNSEAWKDHIKRHPWYRYMPLMTCLATWDEFGLRYLPTSSKKEAWMDWPNPELNVNIDIKENDKVWKEWSKKCGHLTKTRGIEFYEDTEISDWWSHLHIINKREAMRWLLYSRQDHRWHQSTGTWTYYLGRIPGLKNRQPRTILHSRERPVDYRSSATPMGRDEFQGYSTYNNAPRQQDELLITEREWGKYCRETERILSHCQQLWPNNPVRGPGCNSIGNNTWITGSKEDAFQEQRKLCERVAHHRIGEHKDGSFSYTESSYIVSPYARQEHNLPLFPDHEADMARTGTGEPNGWKYIIRVVNPRLLLKMGKCPVDTWLNNGLTAALMQISPPGFRSGPSQSSEVTYSQPEDSGCPQSRARLLLRDLSRSHDVVQGIAVAKKYEDISKLLGDEVLNQVGPLNHPAP